jgi:hypothetical protein
MPFHHPGLFDQRPGKMVIGKPDYLVSASLQTDHPATVEFVFFANQ